MVANDRGQRVEVHRLHDRHGLDEDLSTIFLTVPIGMELFEDVVVDIVLGFDEDLSTILLTISIGKELFDDIIGAFIIGAITIGAISIGTIDDTA